MSELTVIIPVYNRAETVRATLLSVERQTLRPLKVILIDNNSSDGTMQTLEQWRRRVDAPGFRVAILSEPLAGAAAARNRGLREADTPYTMFFDSDDLMAPGHCHRALDGFRRHPDADIIGWDCNVVTPTGKKGRLGFYTHSLLWNNIFHGGMSTQRYAARTALFRRAGGWDTTCRGWDDVELGCRLLQLKPVVRKLRGRPTVTVVRSEQSITGTDFHSSAPLWEHSLDLMEHTAGLSTPNLRRALLAGDYRREGAEADSSRLLAEALGRESSALRRGALRFARFYRGLGLPGISYFLHLFNWNPE